MSTLERWCKDWRGAVRVTVFYLLSNVSDAARALSHKALLMDRENPNPDCSVPPNLHVSTAKKAFLSPLNMLAEDSRRITTFLTFKTYTVFLGQPLKREIIASRFLTCWCLSTRKNQYRCWAILAKRIVPKSSREWQRTSILIFYVVIC